jgi:Arc/MetJ family transcription regulator
MIPHPITARAMRTTLSIDDDLLHQARQMTGIEGTSSLVREALRALIERESAGRLSALGGSEPHLRPVPRRRGDPA